jgi:hypothetical protein
MSAIDTDGLTIAQLAALVAAGGGGAISYAQLPTGGGTWANGGALSITGGDVTVPNLIATDVTGTLLTASQPNITTIGTLIAGAVPASLVTPGTFPEGSWVVGTSASFFQVEGRLTAEYSDSAIVCRVSTDVINRTTFSLQNLSQTPATLHTVSINPVAVDTSGGGHDLGTINFAKTQEWTSTGTTINALASINIVQNDSLSRIMTWWGTGPVVIGPSVGTDPGTGNSLILTSSATDAATKAGRIGVRHFTNAEEPMLMIRGNVTSAVSEVDIGGGSSTFNTATQLRFFTAATQTTLTGSGIAGMYGTATWSAASTTAVAHTIPNLMLVDQTGTQASGAYGASIGFSRIADTTFSSELRGAAIVARQATASANRVGLSFWVHDSATGGTALSEAMQLNVAGDIDAGFFGNVQALSTTATKNLGAAGATWATLFGTAVDSGAATDLLLKRNAVLLQSGTALGLAWATNSPTILAASANDYALPQPNIVRLSSSVNVNVTGFVAATVDGTFKLLINIGSFAITLPHLSASSSAANRIYNPAGAAYVLNPGDSVWAWYDLTSAFWRTL